MFIWIIVLLVETQASSTSYVVVKGVRKVWWRCEGLVELLAKLWVGGGDLQNWGMVWEVSMLKVISPKNGFPKNIIQQFGVQIPISLVVEYIVKENWLFHNSLKESCHKHDEGVLSMMEVLYNSWENRTEERNAREVDAENV